MKTTEIFSKNPYKTILASISCILWGSAFPVLKISYSELQISQNDMIAKILLAGIRFFLASTIIFLFISFILKKSVKVNRTYLLKLLTIGILQTSLYYFLFYNGVANTQGMKAAIIGAMEIFFVIIIAHIIYTNDKINRTKIIGLVLGFLGIIIVNWGNSFILAFNFKGEGFLILSSFIGAISAILAKNLSRKIPPSLITAWQMFLGSIILLVFGYINLSSNAIIFNTKGSLLLIYSAFLSATAFSIWYTLLKYNKAGEISLYKFITPVSGAILSSIFLPNEYFTFNILISLILVVLGIILVNINLNRD